MMLRQDSSVGVVALGFTLSIISPRLKFSSSPLHPARLKADRAFGLAYKICPAESNLSNPSPTRGADSAR